MPMPIFRVHRALVIALASASVAGFAFGLTACGSGGGKSTSATAGATPPTPSRPTPSRPTPSRPTPSRPTPSRPTPRPPAHRIVTRSPPARRKSPQPPFAVGLRVLSFVDRSRDVRLPGAGLAPRTLVTLVRYPAMGPRTALDVVGAPPARAGRPFPLIVFGHGFAVTPAIYAPLLQAWARAGYIVAAPVFPLENADAPGGPNESDLVNEPRDMTFVISRMLAASADLRGAFAGLVDPREIAVAGQSDGGETALAVAYDRPFLDTRVRAAVILSGAQIPGIGPFAFPVRSPPLLAAQGTADVINPPRRTDAFFDIAPDPKYLLTLFGASHLGPYTDGQPQLAVVERVTVAFLDRYLKGGVRALKSVGDVPGTSALQAEP